ncbi:uncharacterized protein AC631_05048 [Debaryomyces fabryi]|uniref:Uncharacterized protein n=1 Tax=Debaryomyces fabryi TaxID=58627 RepID=A0A0V1PSI6_9ASCO|nr:uncharacterized protein AC631_05048 [Debaryomyces fabryi]KRZ99191.1 hypothetical protein AC631_05048 [Debaryomyces fabryi]CUM55986.1 unnamed protein product [Debaryomyces fabryi]
MDSKSTLDRKYQRSRELGYIPRKTIHRSPLKFETIARNRSTYTPKYNLAKYTPDEPRYEGIRYTENKIVDSPIRSLSLLPYTPSKLQPTRLYKLFNESTPVNKGILITNRNRRYDGKNRKASTLEDKKGIFSRLRSFLVKFSLSSHEHDQTDLNLLRKSAKNVLNVRESPEVKGNKRVWFEKDDQKEIKRRDISFDEPKDLVDEATIRRRQHYESEQTRHEFNDLQDIIQKERDNSERLKAKYDDKIKSLKSEFDHRTEELNEKILVLQRRASLHVDELEKTKLDQLERELFREHEKFLVKQKEQEQELSKERQRLQTLRYELNSKRSEIENDLAKLKEDQKIILKQRLEIGLKSKKLDDLNEGNLLKRRKARDFDSNDVVVTRLKLNQQRYRQERKLLNEEKQIIRSDLEENEKDYVHFFEKLIDISQSILKGGDSHKEYILNDFETLLESLNTKEMPKKLLIRFESIKRKFSDYLDAFQRFQLAFSRLGIQDIGEEYSIDNLIEIRTLFTRLTESFSKSIYKKRKRLYQMNQEISAFQISLMSSSTSSQRCRDIAKAYDKRSKVLNEMKVLNELLVSLSILLKQLEEIIIIIGHSPNLSQNSILLDIDLIDELEI